MVRLAPLSPSDRRSFLALHALECPRRHALLDQAAQSAVVQSEAARHPLFLRMLLAACDAVAAFAPDGAGLQAQAVGAALGPLLDVSTAAESDSERAVDELLSKLLQRCEAEVEVRADGSDRGLFGRAMSMLYVLQQGGSHGRRALSSSLEL